ncbi:hypothetical protein M1I95_21735 [Rossellomorea marisflavi]|uniref:hypothetical protein n=1 Tax=Rossellomorea marisflavi TaxID=189381 RepID=UPI0027A67161|nr:hypothetical protein [Rossellomorea marisflavi]UTE72814.1 hypothetical protein M1I95_21735 [Rossellomorea marisflavi]
MEEKMRHLEMIQNVISRMASNSFLLKGWTVTLVVGLLAFANIKEMDSNFMFLALIPAAIFWFLDGYFIHQSWLYVELYNHVTKTRNEDIDFSLDAKPYEDLAGSHVEGIFSHTLLIFYVPTLAVIIIAICFFK